MSPRDRRAVTMAVVVLAAGAVFATGLLVGRLRPPPRAAAEEAPATSAPREAGGAYRLLVEVPLRLRAPTGVAAGADGRFFVCGDRVVLAVDRAGAESGRWPLEAEPRCIALRQDGSLAVGLADHVLILDPRTGAVTPWPDLGSQALVTSVAAVGTDVLVADAGNRVVMRFDAAGGLAQLLVANLAAPSPYLDVAAAPDGTVWAADPGNHRLLRFGAAGTESSWGSAGNGPEAFAGCCNPAHIAVLPCGSVVTSEKGILRVKVHEPGGALEAVVAEGAELRGETSVDVTTRKANGGEVILLLPAKRVVRVYVKRAAG